MGKGCKHLVNFFNLPIWRNPITIVVIWAIFAIVATITKGGFSGEKLNNYLIFRQVFYHLRDCLPLYAEYPAEYGDVNHYGPVFALIIAPFALLPKFVGLLLWQVALGASLFFAIRTVPLKHNVVMAVLWIVTLEILTSMQMAQFNIAIAAMVVGAYVAVKSNRNWLAALLIMLGTMTKLYAVVAVVFILFTKRKANFVLWLLIWGVILFVAPMLLSSPDYVVGQYVDWYHSIVEKNALNVEVGVNTVSNNYQNVSVMGMLHRITQSQFSDLFVLVPAVLLFFLPLCNRSKWNDAKFQWGVVASALMCIILFSTGSENSGYVIAMTGVALWFVASPCRRTRCDVALLVFAMIVVELGTSDLLPRAISKGVIRAYSLKALPVLCVWLRLLWQMCVYRKLVEPADGNSEQPVNC